MRKSFLFNIFFLVFVNFLIKPFWVFGIDRTVQNQLGEAEYGIYFAVFNFTYLFQILLDFGLQNYNARHVAADINKINELLPNILIFKTILFIIYLLVCVAFAYPINYINYNFLYIILINHFLLSFIIYLRSNVAAHQHFITDSLLSILDKSLMILFCGILIWGNTEIKLNILNFTLAQLIAYLITFIVCLAITLNLSSATTFQFSKEKIKTIIWRSLPYAITYFLMTTYYRIDGVMLERMKGSEETGIYAQGYRIIESVNNIGYLIGLILLPLFSYYIAQKKDIKLVLFPSLKIMIVIITAVVGVFYFQSESIINLLYHHNQVYSAKVFSWLILNFIPIGILYVIGTLLTAQENFKIMLPTISIAVLLNIILNYIWIQKQGAIGAAMATFVTQIFVLIVYSYSVIKTLNLKVNYKNITKHVLFIFCCILCIQVCIHFFSNDNMMNILARTLIYLGFVSIASVLFGIINKDILNLKTGLH